MHLSRVEIEAIIAAAGILVCFGLAIGGWIYLMIVYIRLRRGSGETTS